MLICYQAAADNIIELFGRLSWRDRNESLAMLSVGQCLLSDGTIILQLAHSGSATIAE
jgi:hypothetical protein